MGRDTGMERYGIMSGTRFKLVECLTTKVDKHSQIWILFSALCFSEDSSMECYAFV